MERSNGSDEENGSNILGVEGVALGMTLMAVTRNVIVSVSVVLVPDASAEEEDVVFRSRDLSRQQVSCSEQSSERWSLMVIFLVLQYFRDEECYNTRWAR